MGNLEGTRVGNKLGIFDGEVTGITLGVSYRSKFGDDKGSGPVLSGGYFESLRGGKLDKV